MTWLDRINELVSVGDAVTVCELVPEFMGCGWPKTSVYSRINNTITNAEKYKMWARVGKTSQGVQIWKRLI